MDLSTVMFKVDYHWDRLKTCVVGRAYPPEHFSWVTNPKIRSALERIMIETEEDFQKLISVLESFEVKVLRPNLSQDQSFKKPMVAPRDFMAMIGEIFYCDVKGYETEIQPILNEIEKAGNHCFKDLRVNSANVSRLGNELYFGMPEQRKLLLNHLDKSKLKNIKDISVIDNFIGMIGQQHPDSVDAEIDRLTKLFPDHYCRFIEGTEGHIDGTISLIKPGLLLLGYNDDELIRSCMKYFPDYEIIIPRGHDKHLFGKFQQAKTINGGKWWLPGEENNYALTEFVDEYLSDWVGLISETVFEVNTLMIDQGNAVCVNFTDNILNAYDKHGVTAHAVDFRHRFFWDGCTHCITADLDREPMPLLP